MSNEQENAPASAPEEEKADSEEPAAKEEEDDDSRPEELDAGVDVEHTQREAKVAPDISELPDEIADDFEKAIEATVLKFKEGDIVEGEIVSIDAEGAMVDIGYKSEGLIPVRELSIRNNIEPKDTMRDG